MSSRVASDPGDVAHAATVPYRVRFDECGPDGLARTSTLLRYAQDVAWIHSERLGFTRAWYAERDLAWVVRAAELAILAPVPLGTTLSVTTSVTGFRKVWARRRTEARLPDGGLALWGHTDWVITDAARGAPTRVPPEFHAAFASSPGTFEPGRVPLPPTPSDAAVVHAVVRPQDLDPLDHVNNAAYLDYLEEALLASGDRAAAAISALPRTVLLEYLWPAAHGASVVGAAWPLAPTARVGGMDGQGHSRSDDDDGGWAWRLADADGRELARGRLIERRGRRGATREAT